MAVSDLCFELWYIFHHILNLKLLEEIIAFGGDKTENQNFCKEQYNYTKRQPKI